MEETTLPLYQEDGATTDLVQKNLKLEVELWEKKNEISLLHGKIENLEDKTCFCEPGQNSTNKCSNIRDILFDNDELSKKLKRRDKQIGVLEQRVDLFLEHNSSMQLRDAEFSFSKLQDVVGSRPVLLLESSVFSEFSHTSDPVLAEKVIPVLDASNFKHTASKVGEEHFLVKGKFSKSALYRLKDGTGIIVKKYLMWEGEEADVKNLQFVTHEMRLLDYIGSHLNVVNPYGLVHLDQGFFIALHYVGNMSLAHCLAHLSTEQILQSVVEGVASALLYLHEKGVVHNYLTSGNILLKQAGDGYRPVVIGFSFASRLSVAKIFSKEFIRRFDGSNHLAPEVLLRKSAPSHRSDVFSFGIILRRILQQKLPLAEYPLYKLKKLMTSCISYDKELRPFPNVLFQDINSAFFDMFAV